MFTHKVCTWFCLVLVLSVVQSGLAAENLDVKPDPEGAKYFHWQWDNHRTQWEKEPAPNKAGGTSVSIWQNIYIPSHDIAYPFQTTIPKDALITKIRGQAREMLPGYPWRDCTIAYNVECPQGGAAILPPLDGQYWKPDEADGNLVVTVRMMNWSGTLSRMMRIIVEYDCPPKGCHW